MATHVEQSKFEHRLTMFATACDALVSLGIIVAWMNEHRALVFALAAALLIANAYLLARRGHGRRWLLLGAIAVAVVGIVGGVLARDSGGSGPGGKARPDAGSTAGEPETTRITDSAATVAAVPPTSQPTPSSSTSTTSTSTSSTSTSSTSTSSTSTSSSTLAPVSGSIRPSSTGGVTLETWSGQVGGALLDVDEAVLPSASTVVGQFAAPLNRGDNIATRLSAYLQVQQSGAYTFWLKSDDEGMLFLSYDGNPASKVLIAYGEYRDIETEPITLESGKLYYIEAISKEETGDDFLTVEWLGPAAPIREVISRSALTAVERNDGWRAYPPDAVGVAFESWEGYTGADVVNIEPGALRSSIDYLYEFSSPRDRGDNQGTRLSGLLWVAKSGLYTFWFTSDDEGMLFLSKDDQPANKDLIATSLYRTTETTPVQLEAGIYYYIEAISKESYGDDFLTVEWIGPGLPDREIVGAQHIIRREPSGIWGVE
ncbi:MAG: hypothetical protein AB7U97_26455 [Pirellulales bacterium]